MSKASIVKKIVFQFPITLETPMRIGTGQDDGIVDIRVIKNGQGNPYIPATSLAGVLRHEIKALYNEKVASLLFGTIDEAEDWKGQSRLIIDDVELKDSHIIHRDSVAIDQWTNIAKDSAKFDFEAIDSGATGTVHMEVTLREGDMDLARWDDLMMTIMNLFTTGIRLGALTTKGFGQIKCTDDDACYYVFDFKKSGTYRQWLNYIHNDELPGGCGRKATKSNKNMLLPPSTLAIDMRFGLTSSLIIRDYDVEKPSDSDETIAAVQMKSNGQYVIPGTTVKGIVSHCAKNILFHLLDEQTGDTYLKHLMGYANEAGGTGHKSRLSVNEVYIPIENVTARTHTRNRISRFTGGTLDGALFTEEPIWKKQSQKEPIEFQWQVEDCQEGELGLLLLVIKELWLGRITVGGDAAIGRGVLHGSNCELKFKGWDITLKEVDKAIEVSGMKNHVQTTPEECMDFLESCVGKIGG